MLSARSRIETVPTTAPPSVTGRCRNPPKSIWFRASPTDVSGSIVMGSPEKARSLRRLKPVVAIA